MNEILIKNMITVSPSSSL